MYVFIITLENPKQYSFLEYNTSKFLCEMRKFFLKFEQFS